MVIRRASDSTTTTIGFDGSGNIDEAAITTFCTGTSCTVYQWLDQSGNGNTATAQSGQEPTIYTGGAIVKDNGRAMITADATEEAFDIPITSTDAYKIFSVIQSHAPHVFLGSQNPNDFFFIAESGNTGSGAGANFSLSSSRLDGNSYTIGTRDEVYNDLNIRRLFYADIDLNFQGSTVQNSYGGNSIYRMYNSQELIFYPASSTNSITSIESNIGDYFTQNTPLLDTYTGAAAAYSLRKLRTAYTGDAVEVYNGSSYADIGFNVFGELDTVALAAHCGSNDGFVSKWYDQAGSNDATQGLTANMPKIYDGTTGVVTENGKVALDFDGSDDYLKTSDYIVELSQNAASLFAVSQSNALSSTQYLLSEGDSSDPYSSQFILGGGGNLNGNIILWVNSTEFGTMQTGQRLIGFDYNQTNFQAYINGAASGSAATATVNTETSLYSYIGTRADGTTSFFNGKIQELITYKTNKSSVRTDIEENIATFYDITI